MARNTNWSIPRMWEGQSAVVLASGPSMSAEVADAVRYTTQRVIAVNNTWQLAPWADMLYAADASWWQKYYADTAAFKGLKVTCSEVNFDDVLRLKHSGREGFDPDPSCIRDGGNSGYQAIHIAVHAGCKRILLCGFDMHGGHWHSRHEYPLREHGEGIFERWLKRFETLVAPLAERGVEVINCTSGSALKFWPHLPLADALNLCNLQGHMDLSYEVHA